MSQISSSPTAITTTPMACRTSFSSFANCGIRATLARMPSTLLHGSTSSPYHLALPMKGSTASLLTSPATFSTPASADARLHDLTDGQTLSSADSPPLTVIHTPGHIPDSICLRLGADGPLFTGDTVLGGSTSVFEELAPYLASLRRLLASPAPLEELYPGHGPVEEDGRVIVEMYVKDRLEREAQIIDVLGKSPTGVSATAEKQLWTVWMIVQTMYRGYLENLWDAAAGSVIVHLRKLKDKGKVKCLGGEGRDRAWELLQ